MPKNRNALTKRLIANTVKKNKGTRLLWRLERMELKEKTIFLKKDSLLTMGTKMKTRTKILKTMKGRKTKKTKTKTDGFTVGFMTFKLIESLNK